MLTREEYPEMNVGTGRFSDDVDMTVLLIISVICWLDIIFGAPKADFVHAGYD